ncbi:Cytochrome b6 [Planctomycetaceae bacterium]|nr:Cytochrome b6 [Planctomycetaceae bacterium]
MSEASQAPEIHQGAQARPAALFRALEKCLRAPQDALARFVPDELNLFMHLGAAANTSLIISAASGILLLFFYVPAVDQAYDSLTGPVALFIRTLHRYSSDACMLLVLLHVLKTFAQARFVGARWLAWFTGLLLLFTLWIDGWLGYWMLWDESGAETAKMTAAMVDRLGLFSNPLSRGFASHGSLNSLLFFVVFFCHIAIPLLLAAGIWLHLLRINKPRLLTNRPLTLALVLSLLVVSLIFSAPANGEADLGKITGQYVLDPWYQLPLLLYERAGEGVLWLAALFASLALIAVPWVFGRRRRAPAKVNSERCTGCEQCVKDCPFGANAMIQLNGRKVSSIDPDKCTSCGICVGSCSPAAIVLPELPLADVREKIDRWYDGSSHDELIFLCREACVVAPESISAEGTHTELPGVRIIEVPCAGFVHPELVQRAQRRGANRVTVAACGADPQFRLGARWTLDRLSGKRDPGDKIRLPAPEKFNLLRLSAFGLSELKRSTAVKPARSRAHWVAGGAVWLALVLLCALSGWITVSPARVPESELVMTFLHSGEVLSDSAQRAGNDVAPHMRGAQTSLAKRAPVAMRVLIDGKEVLNQSYAPSGLSDNGPSSAIERIAVVPGEHLIRIELNDTGIEGPWKLHDSRVVKFSQGQRHVVRFETGRGFTWE